MVKIPAVFLFLILCLSCTKSKTSFVRDNPLDPGGIYAPKVTGMADTTVAQGVFFYLHAQGTDINGIIMKYLWALDGIDFKDSTNSGRIGTRFDSAGIRAVRVKVRDDDDVESEADSILLLVKGNAPISVSPADGALLSTALPVLRWIPGWYKTGFTVFLDTVKSPVAVAMQSTTDSFFACAATLKPGTSYFWQVVGRNALGQTAVGAVWQFTTPPEPSVSFAMTDTNFMVNDSFYIYATGKDPHGTITRYFWTLHGFPDGDSTGTGRIKVVYGKAGPKTIFVRVRSSTGLESQPAAANLNILPQSAPVY